MYGFTLLIYCEVFKLAETLLRPMSVDLCKTRLYTFRVSSRLSQVLYHAYIIFMLFFLEKSIPLTTCHAEAFIFFHPSLYKRLAAKRKENAGVLLVNIFTWRKARNLVREQRPRMRLAERLQVSISLRLLRSITSCSV